jgi:hypothetical protein
MTIERLQTDKPDVAKLIAEIESGKVGASIAVSQNVQLKAQLEEMQRAFVQIVSVHLHIPKYFPILIFNQLYFFIF